MTKFIGILSGKGGVGKTTVSINTTVALRRFGRDIILVDGDLEKANISLHLGAHHFKTTIHEVLWGNVSLDKAVYTHPVGIRFIPAGFSAYHMLNSDPSMLLKIPSVLKDVAEVVLIDLPFGTNDYIQAILPFLDEIFVVTNPELPCIVDTLKYIKIIEKQKKIAGIIVNKNHEYGLKKESIETMLSLPVISVIPFDKAITESLQKEKPFMNRNVDTSLSKAFKDLASKMIGESSKHNETTSSIQAHAKRMAP